MNLIKTLFNKKKEDTTSEAFDRDLDKAQQARKELSDHLDKLVQILDQSESQGKEKKDASGSLELEKYISNLKTESDKLKTGVFRLLVLGDMKRGKSTFLNALLGEKDLLPTAVNPCTAILTVLRYGKEKVVKVFFKDGQSETLSFELFKEKYTIKPNEATRLEQEDKSAFPNVNQAVVEYPLDILKKRVEIVDSPGLNDTKERNAITLDYVKNCHAILFVLSANQQFTQGERDYLNTYLKGRGLTVFFLINQWDLIREKLLDEKDLPKEEAGVRQRFRKIIESHLSEEKQKVVYESRVFEMSARNALRQILKRGSLEGTGFPEFTKMLGHFLVNERLEAELRPSVQATNVAYFASKEAVERRIPLLRKNLADLKQIIESVSPLFSELQKIRDEFRGEIKQTQDRFAIQLADSFCNRIRHLENTFDGDFSPPQLRGTSENDCKTFNKQISDSFENYLNAKLSDWTREAERELKDAFSKLTDSGEYFISSYNQIYRQISQRLQGGRQVDSSETFDPSRVKSAVGNVSVTNPNGELSTGTAAAMGVLVGGSLAGGTVGSIAGATAVTLIPTISSAMFASVVLAPVAILAILGGIWARNSEIQDYIDRAKAQLKKNISGLKDKRSTVENSVRDSFENIFKVVRQMDDNIRSQSGQLSNLLSQMEKGKINQEAEEKRLNQLRIDIDSSYQQIQASYRKFTGTK
ncbi:MAG: hypothetical protein BWK78_02340 [Thiotrichaceae bacterium IS1]|nr:MAG: hypothetical protein BWK78_02340 [Thiotrichaceae bacterium IS1]